MKTFSNIFIIFIFIFMILTPLFFTIYDFNKKSDLDENRIKTKLPSIEVLKKEGIKTYFKQVKTYLKDNFGFRDKLIKFNSKLYYKVFSLSSSRNVIIGKDKKWFFYTGDPPSYLNAIESYRGARLLNKKEIKKITEPIIRRKEKLEKMGIKYVFMIAPNKHSIYGEHLPLKYKKITKNSISKQITKALKGKVFVVNTIDEVYKNKHLGKLYERYGTHWNFLGAYVSYCYLIKEIKKHFPSLKISKPLKYKSIKWVKNNGKDLVTLMAMEGEFKEEFPYLQFDKPFSYKKEKLPKYLKNITNHPIRIPEIYKSSNQNLETALIIHDSFFTRISPFISNNFTKTTYIWRESFKENLIKPPYPSIIIEERVERMFYPD